MDVDSGRTVSTTLSKRFPCAAAGNAMIDRWNCAATTSTQRRNADFCTRARCGSPWRKCRICILQGCFDENARVRDIDTGLCSFHIENGEKAKREVTYVGPLTRAARTTKAPFPLDSEVKVIPRSDNPKKQIETMFAAQPAPTRVCYSEPLPNNSEAESARNEKPSSNILSAIKLAELVSDIPIDRIRPLPGQPRTEFDPEELRALGESLLAAQIQPVLLRRVYDDPTNIDYELIDGERRWRACSLVGKTALNGVLYEGVGIEDAKKLYALSVIANFGRSEHTALERARATERLMRDFSLSLTQVGKLFGKAESTLKSDIGLLKLSPVVQALMNRELPKPERLMPAAGSVLASYPVPFQEMAARKIIKERIDATKVRRFIRVLANETGYASYIPNMGRRPRDDVENALRLLKHVGERLTTLLNPPIDLSDCFGRARGSRRAAAHELITAVQEALKSVQERIPTRES